VATVTCFEDLMAWQHARELTRTVYPLTRHGEFAKDFALCDQVRRAAVSVMANVAEGFERDGRAEFRQFLAVAKGSAGELRSHLCVALDQGYIDRATFEATSEKCRETARVIRGLIDYLRGTRMRGSKFRPRDTDGNSST
jgi:four helix bundle protein